MTSTDSHRESHTLTLVKNSLRQLREDVIPNNFAALLASVNNRTLKASGWTVSIIKPDGTIWTHADDSDMWKQESAPEEAEFNYVNTVTIAVDYDHNKPAEEGYFGRIASTISKRASTPKYGSWMVTERDGKPYEMSDDELTNLLNAELAYAEATLPENWEESFGHLYGLTSHIRRAAKALQTAISSEWTKRFHVVLVGSPGCGKSDICRTFRRILGEEAVWEIDCTATTAAGVIKELSERKQLPRVIVAEEIEKGKEDFTQVMLALLDFRAEVRKTTARTNVQRDCKVFVIATVNNVEHFDKMNAGALSSRFATRIFFKRPNRDTCARILAREVNEVGGDIRWIDYTLDYWFARNVRDPRILIAECLIGGDDWLDGSYIKMLEETSEDANQDIAEEDDHEF